MEGDVHDGTVVGRGLTADREQLPGQLGAGGGEEFGDGALLDDAAVLHQRGRVADRLHHVHLMRDEHDGQAQLAVEVAQQLEDGAGGLRVQGAGGLVGEQHLGVAGQRAGDADALLLPAGELGGVGLGLVGEADQVQQLQRLAGAFTAVDLEDLQRQFDVVLHGARGQQIEVLEDHADVAAGGAQRGAGTLAAAGDGGQFLAGDGDRAGGGALQEVEAADEGGLAGAALADDAVHLALTDVQIDAVQGGDFAVS